MINTISKTLGAQEKTQDIKQSPSTKIGTKPDARSRRNELTEGTGRCTGAAQDAPMHRTLHRTLHRMLRSSNSRVNSSDRTLHRTLHRTLQCTGHCTGRCIGRCTGRSDQATAESTAATGRCIGRCTGRSDAQDAAPDAAQDAECQSLVNISKVPESRFRHRMRPVSADRTLVRVWSVAEKWDFIPNGYFLSGAYK